MYAAVLHRHQARLLQVLGLGLGRAGRDDRLDGRQHVAYAKPARRTWLLLGADLIVTALALLSTAILQTPHATKIGVMPVTATWLAGPALAWAVARRGASRASRRLVIGGCVVWLRWPILRYLLEHGAGRAQSSCCWRRRWSATSRSCSARAEHGLAAGNRDRGREPGAGTAGPHDSRLGAAGTRDGPATRRGGWRRGRRDRASLPASRRPRCAP